jgi:UDP-N-acetylmuramyl pentapeptide phosphotransferase/UDP-N-acetylglucosamine-1-phosphate transferase
LLEGVKVLGKPSLAVSVLVFLSTFGLSYLLTRRLLKPSSLLFVLDHPNERSLHDQPMPRGGGIAIAAGIALGGTAIGVAYHQYNYLPWLGLGASAIVLVSFLDDRFDVSPFVRLAVHFFVALLLVDHGFILSGLELPGIQWPLSAALGFALSCGFLVWWVNLYNFMDGMDGLAAGMAVIGFACFGVLGVRADHEGFAMFSFIVAAGACGFLLLNFPPARIFMGDVGSSLLGLFAAALSLWADRESIFPLWAGILVFSPFMVDATVTLLWRVGAGERIWKAHKSHFYQRLVQLGWGHRRTVLWEYVLMLACAVSAITAISATPAVQWFVLVLWVVLYCALIRGIGWLEERA